MLRRLSSLWRTVLRRDSFEDEMRDEMQFHLESRAADLVRRGLPPAEAARQARVEFGSIEKHKEEARERLGLRLLDDTASAVRYALRTFRRDKAFAATAVLTLALGIGANTAIFSLIDALMLQSLPVRSPQELVQLKMRSPGPTASPDESFSYPIVHALDAHRELFSGVTGFAGFQVIVGAPGAADRVPAALVTGSFFETLGLNPIVGRLLTAADDRPGAPLVAVSSYDYWERHLGRDPRVIGEPLVLNGAPVTIVGVTPPGFVGATVGAVADLTLPVSTLPTVAPQAAPLLRSGNFWLRVLARPRRDLSTEQLRARLAAVWRHESADLIPSDWPASERRDKTDAVIELTPGGRGWTYLRSLYDKPLRVLMGSVALLLLIACANVASLLLARGSARQREIAIRLAIGAARRRIVWQLLVESTLLSLIGAVAGVFVAWFSGRMLLDVLSSGRQRVIFDLTPNVHVLGFTVAIAIATGVLFGIAPALQSTASGPAPALRDDVRTATGRTRLLSALVTAQVALSLVLLVGAGLFVRTLQNLRNLDPGFKAEGVLLVDFERRTTAVPTTLLDDVRRLPGVLSGSVSTHTPLNGWIWSEPAVAAGTPLPDRDTAIFVAASPGFFSTLQIPLLMGREFSTRDSASAPHVAIVSESFTRKFLGGTNPVGRQLSAKVRGQRQELQIIGIAADTRATDLRQAPYPTVYVPYDQLSGSISTTLEVRAAGSPNTVASELRDLLRPRFPDMPVEVRPLSEQVQATMVQDRMMALLAGSFGILALVLASVGVYGLLAYGVARRTSEIGIRMALGAQPKGVVSLVVNGMRRPVAAGVLLGLPASWAATRMIASMLFGLAPADPATIAAAVIVLAVVAHVAAYLPARRAASVDPLVALRHQ
jgi:putative ABC transport system permease protein